MSAEDSKDPTHKTYLGDIAYVKQEYMGSITLTAESGREVTNEIILGFQELFTLMVWIRDNDPELYSAIQLPTIETK